MTPDTEVLIIGAGMSGLGLACQLIRKHNLRSFELIEKSNDVGGTWLQNTYPGCGCDVASHFYSYSFEPNAEWTQKFAMREEIQAYFVAVAHKYSIAPHIRFGAAVDSASWDPKASVWRVQVRDVATGKTHERTARILTTAVGALSVPKTLDIPGGNKFKGRVFHSQQWDHSFDWKDKNVVVLGNGCSATQFLPILSSAPNAAARVTQFARSTHYLAERPNPTYTASFKWAMRHVPLVQAAYRFYLYAAMERDFPSLQVHAGTHIRGALAAENDAYVRRAAPPRYWDFLRPKYMIGCKRKVMDTEYLAALWRPNVELVHDDPVVALTEGGVRTRGGRDVEADAVVLATGFATHRILYPLEIRGLGGESLEEYWSRTYDGAPQAFLGTFVPSFPNLVLLNGPNTITGHLSVIYTVECQIGLALRVLGPILTGDHLESKSISESTTDSETASDIKSDIKSDIASAITKKPNQPATHDPRRPLSVQISTPSARADSAWLQRASRGMVWSAGGCANWFLHPRNGMQIMMYPDWQFLFWARCVFVSRADWVYRDFEGLDVSSVDGVGWERRALGVLGVGVVGGVAWGVGMVGRKILSG